MIRVARVVLLGSMFLIACNNSDLIPHLGVTSSPIKIGGSNCAGVHEDTTGVPVVTNLAAFYQVLALDVRKSDSGRLVIETRVPAAWEAGNHNWLAKVAQIVGRDDAVGYVGGDVPYYEGDLELIELTAPDTGCETIDPARYDKRGLMTHTAMLQLARCPSPDEDGYNKVGDLALVWIGDDYDVDQLVEAGIARYLASTDAPPRVCLVHDYARVGSAAPVQITDQIVGGGQCVIALREDAVIEAIVFDVDSRVVYNDVPVRRRAFTARGVRALPNGLDAVRKVLRSGELSTLELSGDPQVMYLGGYDDGTRVHHRVRFVGHATAALASPNAFITDDERPQIEAMSSYLDRGLIVFVNSDTRSRCQPVCPSPAVDPPAEGRRCTG